MVEEIPTSEFKINCLDPREFMRLDYEFSEVKDIFFYSDGPPKWPKI